MRDGEFLREGSTVTPRFGVVQWAQVWYPWMREPKEQVLGRRLSL
jgi:hypothetical protein